MKRVTRYIAFFILLISTCGLYAKEQPDSLTFSGVIKSPDGTPLRCKVRLSYSTEDGSGTSESTFRKYVQTDKQGRFFTKFPNLSKPYLIRFCICNEKSLAPFFRSQNFFTESGDKVSTIIEIDTLTSMEAADKVPYKASFSGVGAKKYQVAWYLQNPFRINGFSKEHKILWKARNRNDPDDPQKYLESVSLLIRKQKLIKDSLISDLGISQRMQKLLRLTYGGFEAPLNQEWWFRCWYEYIKNASLRQQIGAIYFKYDKEFSEQPDDNAIYSNSYLAEQAKRIVFELMIKNNLERVDIKDLHNLIKVKYQGATRDYLWRYVMVHEISPSFDSNLIPFDNRIKDSLIVDELNIAKMPLAIKGLKRELSAIRIKNNTIFDGTFDTLDGTKITLSSLRGKVVLLDVWFNGCTGCAIFHNSFNTIYPKFKDNKNFVVLSVNVDKTKQRWVSGIDSKHYTSREKGYLNVTTGNWFDHPFMNYYNIVGASYVMLIGADGKILPDHRDIDELAAEISRALAKIDKGM